MKKVILCDGAKKSLEQALERYSGPSLRQKMAAGMQRKIEMLCRGEQLSADTVKKEAKLPDNGGYFFRIRHDKLRCYWWSTDGTVYISHFIYKDFQKLRDADKERVKENWRREQKRGRDTGGIGNE